MHIVQKQSAVTPGVPKKVSCKLNSIDTGNGAARTCASCIFGDTSMFSTTKIYCIHAKCRLTSSIIQVCGNIGALVPISFIRQLEKEVILLVLTFFLY